MSYCHVQVEVEKVQRSFEHSHMVQWLEKAVIDNVKKEEVSDLFLSLSLSFSDGFSLSLSHTHTHTSQDASIMRCISDLKQLAAT